VRPEAKGAIDALNKMGIRTLLLTGDSRAVADAVARRLGISEIVAEALPEEKLARIRVLVKGEGRTCAEDRIEPCDIRAIEKVEGLGHQVEARGLRATSRFSALCSPAAPNPMDSVLVPSMPPLKRRSLA
jgi:magnesium-transporting ATPase (P-type)